MADRMILTHTTVIATDTLGSTRYYPTKEFCDLINSLGIQKEPVAPRMAHPNEQETLEIIRSGKPFPSCQACGERLVLMPGGWRCKCNSADPKEETPAPLDNTALCLAIDVRRLKNRAETAESQVRELTERAIRAETREKAISEGVRETMMEREDMRDRLQEAEAQVRELTEEKANMVPCFRISAMEAEVTAAEAKTAKVQKDAESELHLLENGQTMLRSVNEQLVAEIDTHCRKRAEAEARATSAEDRNHDAATEIMTLQARLKEVEGELAHQKGVEEERERIAKWLGHPDCRFAMVPVLTPPDPDYQPEVGDVMDPCQIRAALSQEGGE